MIRMLPNTTTTNVIIGPFIQPGRAKRRATERFVWRGRAGGGRRSGDDKGDPLAGCEYLFGELYQSGHGLSSVDCPHPQPHSQLRERGAAAVAR
jgi:hypothetical protein